jgi:hypothetical protein
MICFFAAEVHGDATESSSPFTLQTNVIGVLPGSGTRLRAFVDAGGGIADVHRRVHLKESIPVFLPLPDLFTNPVFPDITFTTIERDISSSQSALVSGLEGGSTTHSVRRWVWAHTFGTSSRS